MGSHHCLYEQCSGLIPQKRRITAKQPDSTSFVSEVSSDVERHKNNAKHDTLKMYWVPSHHARGACSRCFVCPAEAAAPVISCRYCHCMVGILAYLQFTTRNDWKVIEKLVDITSASLPDKETFRKFRKAKRSKIIVVCMLHRNEPVIIVCRGRRIENFKAICRTGFAASFQDFKMFKSELVKRERSTGTGVW